MVCCFWAAGTHWEIIAVNQSSWAATVPDFWWVAADLQPDVQKYSFFTTGLQKGLTSHLLLGCPSGQLYACGCFPACHPALFYPFTSSQPICFEPRPSTQGLRPNHHPALKLSAWNLLPNLLDVDVDLLVSCCCLRPFNCSRIAQLFLLPSCQAVHLRLCPNCFVAQA